MVTTDNVNNLLDLVKEKLGCKNEKQLAGRLQTSAPQLSKLRHGRVSFGPVMLIMVHEATHIPIRELKQRLGLPAANPWPPIAQ